jgi:hypothetical protein
MTRLRYIIGVFHENNGVVVGKGHTATFQLDGRCSELFRVTFAPEPVSYERVSRGFVLSESGVTTLLC